jgi:hypothetical protein
MSFSREHPLIPIIREGARGVQIAHRTQMEWKAAETGQSGGWPHGVATGRGETASKWSWGKWLDSRIAELWP